MSGRGHSFDAAGAEARLRTEAESWDTSRVREARPEDIPVLDVARWFRSGRDDDAVARLRGALENVGFFQLVGHDLPRHLVDDVLDATRRFHDLPAAAKERIRIDREGWPLRGVGHLPLGERRLPRRSTGNRNEAFLVKFGGGISPEDNQWPPEHHIPGFRDVVERYAAAVGSLARRLVPLHALALDLDPTWFDPAFTDPFSRLRLSRYPPERADRGPYGIAPHVDTTFFTLLVHDGPGLVVHHAPSDSWVEVPDVPGAVVVNGGELLRQWSNDRVLSARHFVRSPAGRARHAVPFFFNADPDHVMECLPSCRGPGRPPKYPPVSYRQSQASVQGE